MLKCEIGMVAGVRYKLIRDKRGNQGFCNPEWYNEWRWFLWVDDNYVGDFRTKAEAFDWLNRDKIKLDTVAGV